MSNKIYPCYWLDTQAYEAGAFYADLFGNGQIISDNGFIVLLETGSQYIMLMNGGPKYQVNPSISNYMYFHNRDEAQRIYDAISEDGKVMMPLDKYVWSECYAWVEDKYGISWQLDADGIRSDQKIVPSLLFQKENVGKVKEAVDLYTSIFNPSVSLIEAPYPSDAGLTSGTLLFAQIKIRDYVLNIMSSTLAHDYDFTPGNSIVLECDTQEEIDYYWNELGNGGRYDRCGWLADRFGVSWQIIPSILKDLMSDPAIAQKVAAAFLPMSKFDLNVILAAAGR